MMYRPIDNYYIFENHNSLGAHFSGTVTHTTCREGLIISVCSWLQRALSDLWTQTVGIRQWRVLGIGCILNERSGSKKLISMNWRQMTTEWQENDPLPTFSITQLSNENKALKMFAVCPFFEASAKSFVFEKSISTSMHFDVIGVKFLFLKGFWWLNAAFN